MQNWRDLGLLKPNSLLLCVYCSLLAFLIKVHVHVFGGGECSSCGFKTGVSRSLTSSLGFNTLFLLTHTIHANICLYYLLCHQYPGPDPGLKSDLFTPGYLHSDDL